MRSFSKVLLPTLLTACLLFTGCYQAKVTTNKTAGDRVVQEKWASSFLNGLVPASIDVSDECPNGIASAERNFPFVNGLVATLTLAIYVPQNIKVTCAAGGSMSTALPPSKTAYPVPKSPTMAQLQEAISMAAMKSGSEETVTVRLQTD